jgi:hypothetical protein
MSWLSEPKIDVSSLSKTSVASFPLKVFNAIYLIFLSSGLLSSSSVSSNSGHFSSSIEGIGVFVAKQMAGS